MRRLIRTLRRRAGGKLAEGFFTGASRLGQLHPSARPEKHGVRVSRDVAYAPATELAEHRLDVYRPIDQDGPAPVVLYIHGGGFRILSKDTHWLMGLAFASRGYVVFNIGYRLAPEHPFPAAVEDVSQAFLWMVEHAAEYGADLDRLVIAGESAGANLAASLTLSTVYERDEPFARAVYDTGVVPRATIPACGVFQVSDVHRYERRKPGFPRFLMDQLRTMQDGYLGPRPEDHGEILDFADVVSWLERGVAPSRPLPAFFLPVGTKDPLLDDTRRLDRALRELGGTSVARYYPGGVHAFHAFVFLESARQCWRDQFAFLDQHVPA
ncbi:MAG: alpha/beta hydrolase [Sandaracinaceae bacterium]|nr:alpha/beta hydrolase [Sandaracinaceae bacterium]